MPAAQMPMIGAPSAKSRGSRILRVLAVEAAVVDFAAEWPAMRLASSAPLAAKVMMAGLHRCPRPRRRDSRGWSRNTGRSSWAKSASGVMRWRAVVACSTTTAPCGVAGLGEQRADAVDGIGFRISLESVEHLIDAGGSVTHAADSDLEETSAHGPRYGRERGAGKGPLVGRREVRV